MNRDLFLFAALALVASLPLLPRALTEPLAPIVRAMPRGEVLARLAVEKGLVRDVAPLTEPWPDTCEAQRVWPAPRPVEIEGCETATCAEDGGWRVCSCWELWADERQVWVEDPTGVRVAEDGLEMREDDAFEVVEVDLDGDGEPERVIAALEVVSNGIPFSFWTLRVAGRRVQVPAADYGPASLVEGERGCDLLATDWTRAEDPWRGEGTYFVGQRWRLEGDALRAVGAPRARRLLHSFHLVPALTGPRRGAPATWLETARAWTGEVPGQRASALTFPLDEG